MTDQVQSSKFKVQSSKFKVEILFSTGMLFKVEAHSVWPSRLLTQCGNLFNKIFTLNFEL